MEAGFPAEAVNLTQSVYELFPVDEEIAIRTDIKQRLIIVKVVSGSTTRVIDEIKPYVPGFFRIASSCRAFFRN